MEFNKLTNLELKKEYIKLKKEINEYLKIFKISQINDFKKNIEKINKEYINNKEDIKKLEDLLFDFKLYKLFVSLKKIGKEDKKNYYISLLNKPLNQIYQNKLNINEEELLDYSHYILRKNNCDKIYGLLIFKEENEIIKFNIHLDFELDIKNIENEIKFLNIR